MFFGTYGSCKARFAASWYAADQKNHAASIASRSVLIAFALPSDTTAIN